MNKRSLCISAAAALAVAVALAGCGTTTYFAGRTLPPSGLTNRVLIAIQNPGTLSSGTLQFVDAFYDIRFRYNSTNAAPAFSISGYSGNLPITIQSMPEEQLGAVYGSGDGSLNIVSYSGERNNGGTSGLNGRSSSVFTTRNQAYIFAASQTSHVLTVVDKSSINAGTYPLSLPGVYRVSVNPSGSAALAFVQNSNYVYYPRKLTAAQTAAYSGGPSNWPLGAVDCEPQNEPNWCLFQALDPSTGSPLSFNRPIKAVFSADGGTAYILNCGPECGGTSTANPATTPLSNASVTLMPVAPLIFLIGQASGTLPTQTAINANCAATGSTGGCTIPVPGGASNALVTTSGAQNSPTMYVVGQQLMADTFWGGHLTVLNLSNSTTTTPIPISDGSPGAVSRLLLADDNTLWIGMIQCTTGERANHGQPDGCLTMVNVTNNTATLLPYIGDATGIAAVTGLHKVYTAEGGQVYIYSTVDGTSIDNQYVTVTGTAYDVAYMDATTDGNNTVY